MRERGWLEEVLAGKTLTWKKENKLIGIQLLPDGFKVPFHFAHPHALFSATVSWFPRDHTGHMWPNDVPH